MSGLEEAERVELTVAAVAPGGHCVARVDGQVVFVRHALPGERVLAEVTEVHRGFVRADAVRVLEAAPDRVTPPCPYARPGRCGGCDLQHVAPDAQLSWKAAVVREQLVRLGGLTEADCDALGVRVTALPGGPLGWRSRVRYAVDAAGRAGLLKHRSHEVVPVDRCLIAHPAIQELPVLAVTGANWPDAEAVETVASTGGDVAVTAVAAGSSRRVSGPERVRERAAGREWVLPTSSFWQVHPAAADTLVDAVLELADPGRGAGLGSLRRCRPVRRRVGRSGRWDRAGHGGRGGRRRRRGGPGEPARPARCRGGGGPGGDRPGPSPDHRPGRRGGARPAPDRGREAGGTRRGGRRPACGDVRRL
ncbi:hypothetical protein GCM10029963_27340 [Micromonospora andamanensis]